MKASLVGAMKVLAAQGYAAEEVDCKRLQLSGAALLSGLEKIEISSSLSDCRVNR